MLCHVTCGVARLPLDIYTVEIGFAHVTFAHSQQPLGCHVETVATIVRPLVRRGLVEVWLTVVDSSGEQPVGPF